MGGVGRRGGQVRPCYRRGPGADEDSGGAGASGEPEDDSLSYRLPDHRHPHHQECHERGGQDLCQGPQDVRHRVPKCGGGPFCGL